MAKTMRCYSKLLQLVAARKHSLPIAETHWNSVIAPSTPKRALSSGSEVSREAAVPHVSVLRDEIVDVFAQNLGQREKAVIVDGTLGAGGHSEALLKRFSDDDIACTNLEVFGVDRDPAALQIAQKRLEQWSNFHAVAGNFADFDTSLREHIPLPVDGILLDLGVSSMQLDQGARGFSFRNEGRLDMRMDPSTSVDAWTLVNHGPQKLLETIIRDYGEERNWRRLAAQIVRTRKKAPIDTTYDLVQAIAPMVDWKSAKSHPAARTFQALRIAVNGELDHIERFLEHASGLLNPGGVLAIISFHSLEDRLVKRSFKSHKEFMALHRGAIKATTTECEKNPRSRSAKLRVVVRK